MTQPPPGGTWRVTAGDGSDRWVRPRHGAAAPGPPWAAAHLPGIADAVAAAPPVLRTLWQLAAAAPPGWSWQVWRHGPATAPDSWTLAIEDPSGALQRYAWVRRGLAMVLVAQTETTRAAPPAGGP